MQTKTILIRGGLVQDAVHREPRKVDLLLAGGKIAAIGENLDATADAEVFDAAGLQVFPGFVDAHTHIGLDGYGTNPNYDSIYPASQPGPTFCGSAATPRPVTIGRTGEEASR